MTYFLCALLSVAAFYYIESNQLISTSGHINIFLRKKAAVGLIFVCLIFSWTLILGLQDNVGTDYLSYKKIFSSLASAQLYANREKLFYYISYLLILNKLHPQFGFIFFALIQNICFIIFINKIRPVYCYLFIFLYFFVCTSFYNQTNTIRQFTSIGLCLVSIYFLCKRKLVSYVLIIAMAAMFHLSAVLMIPIYFLYNLIIKTKRVILYVIALICILLAQYNVSLFFNKIAVFYFSYYSEYMPLDPPFINKLTKYIYIPFYLVSLKYLKLLKNKKDIFLYKIGFMSFFIKIALLSSQIALRFMYYFEVVMLFPLYYFLIYYSRDKKIKKYERILVLAGFTILCVAILFSKVVLLPKGEFAYKSIIKPF
jgi:hypothetical protein